MTLEEMKFKMLEQVLNNQLAIMLSHSENSEDGLVKLGLKNMIRRTNSLSDEIKETNHD